MGGFMKYTVSDLMKIFGKSQPSISNWIKSVDDGGLLDPDVREKHVFLEKNGKRERYVIDDIAFNQIAQKKKVVLEKSEKIEEDKIVDVPAVKKDLMLQEQEKQINLMKSMIADLRATNDTYKLTIKTYNSLIDDKQKELDELKEKNLLLEKKLQEKKSKRWWQFWK